MTLPLAAPPTSPTPGYWLVVNLKPTNVAPGSQGLRGLIIAPPNNTGASLTPDTGILQSIGSLQDVEAAVGQGSLGSLCYKALQKHFPQAQLDLVSPTKSGGATAAATATFSGTISVAYTVRYTISGRVIDVPWNVGEAADDIKTKSITYIGRSVGDLYASATSGGTGVVTLTAHGPGPAGNDVTFRVQLIGGTGGSVSVTGSGNLIGGTTEPDFTSALATVSGIEYDFICLAVSNADAVSTTGNVIKVQTHVNGLNTGPASKLSQIVVGHTGLRTAVPAQAAQLNDQVAEIMCAQHADDLPCEVGGAEIGDRMNFRALYFSYNRIGNQLDLYGSPNPVTDNPTTAQSDTALLAGVSLAKYDQNGNVFVLRSVTTYTATSTGAQVLPTDCNEIDGLYDYAKDLRAALPVEFAHAKIINDVNDESQDDLPDGVVECRDVKAFIQARTEHFWIPKGVIDKVAFEASLADGTLIVKVDDVDESQVDIFIPSKAVKDLAKFSTYMSKVF